MMMMTVMLMMPTKTNHIMQCSAKSTPQLLIPKWLIRRKERRLNLVLFISRNRMAPLLSSVCRTFLAPIAVPLQREERKLYTKMKLRRRRVWRKRNGCWLVGWSETHKVGRRICPCRIFRDGKLHNNGPPKGFPATDEKGFVCCFIRSCSLRLAIRHETQTNLHTQTKENLAIQIQARM